MRLVGGVAVLGRNVSPRPRVGAGPGKRCGRRRCRAGSRRMTWQKLRRGARVGQKLSWQRDEHRPRCCGESGSGNEKKSGVRREEGRDTVSRDEAAGSTGACPEGFHVSWKAVWKLLRKGDRSARDSHGLCLLPEGMMNSIVSFTLQRCQGRVIDDMVTLLAGEGREEAAPGKEIFGSSGMWGAGVWGQADVSPNINGVVPAFQITIS